MTKKIHRLKCKGTGFKAACDPEAEPDFYAMPFLENEHQEDKQSDTMKDVGDLYKPQGSIRPKDIHNDFVEANLWGDDFGVIANSLISCSCKQYIPEASSNANMEKSNLQLTKRKLYTDEMLDDMILDCFLSDLPSDDIVLCPLFCLEISTS